MSGAAAPTCVPLAFCLLTHDRNLIAAGRAAKAARLDEEVADASGGKRSRASQAVAAVVVARSTRSSLFVIDDATNGSASGLSPWPLTSIS